MAIVFESELREMVNKGLRKQGLVEEDAKIVTDAIIDAEMRGRKTHGLAHLPRIVGVLRTAKREHIRIVRENEYSALIDGGDNLGPIVAKYAMDLAIAKAKQQGFGIVGTYNPDPFLLAGYYARMALRERMIGIIICNSRARITPWGGIDPVLGVNPISIAIPSKTRPIALDMSLSRITVSDIREAKRTKEQIPADCAIDKDGHPTTDPDKALEGALLPIDTYKGYGLALAIEILAGPLVGGKAGKTVKGCRGYLFVVMNPKIFVSIESFEANVSQLIEEIKSVRKKPSVSEILIPGEGSDRLMEKAKVEGVEVDDSLLKVIEAL